MFEIISSENQLTGQFKAVISKEGSLVHRTKKGYPRLLLQADSATKDSFAAIFSTDAAKLENSAGQTYISVRLGHTEMRDALTGLVSIQDDETTAELARLAGSMTVDADIEGAVLRSWTVVNGPMAGERRYEVIGDLKAVRSVKKFSHLDFPPGSFTLEQTHRVAPAAAAANTAAVTG